MKNWYCLCGNFVKEKRFCPRCKLVRFSLGNGPILDYFGLKLGILPDGLPFNFPIGYLVNHTIVTGQTGTGKTRFTMNLVVKSENYNSKNLNLLIIDVEGEWKNIIPKLKNKTEYFEVSKNLKINPFDLKDPALIRELMRQTVFKGIEKEFIDLSAQMNFVLQEAINESSSIPELINNIKSYDKQKLTALQKTKTALLVRLDPFLRSPLKEIFMCTKSNPDFHELGDYNMIIDLHGLDAMVAYNSEVRLIYNTLTTYFLRKMLNRGTYDYVSNLFVADEAQLLVPKILKKLIITESWPATEFATRLRKRGCGLLLITQSPTNIEQDIFKNTGTKISFRLQYKDDIKLISDSAGFTDLVEYEYLSNHFVKLPRKNAIVSTTGYEPFLIFCDEFTVSNHVPEIKSVIERKIEEFEPNEGVFLDNILQYPYQSVTERRVSLGWNDKKYTKIVDNLLKKKKIEKVVVKLGRGKPKLFYQKPGTIPSIKHEYYVNWIAEKLTQKGYDIKKNNNGPDIEIPKINTAIEIELGRSNMHGNITRNLQKFTKVVICSDEKKVLEFCSSRTKNRKVLFLPIHKIPSYFD